MKKLIITVSAVAMFAVLLFTSGCKKEDGPYPRSHNDYIEYNHSGYGYHEHDLRQIGYSQYTCEPVYKCDICGQIFPNDPVLQNPCQGFPY